MMKISVTMVALLCMAATLPARSIAFSFDDGPKIEKPGGLPPDQRNALLLEKLQQEKIRAILFPTLRDVPPERLPLVEQWGKQGHLIGNHSASHLSLSNDSVSLERYQNDLLLCDSAIRTMPGYVRFYRFPFLKEGHTQERRDGFRQFMKAIQYQPAPVSIDASDWYYNARFLEARSRQADVDPQPYQTAYLQHLLERANFYDSLATSLLGRPVRHIVLLHHNTINALFLNELVAMFRANQWEITDIQTALDDPLYKSEPDVLPAGESIVWSLAKKQNYPDLRYPAESDIYEKSLLDRLGL